MKTRLTLTLVLSALLLVLASVSSLVDARWYDPESGRFISKDPNHARADVYKINVDGASRIIQSNPSLLQEFNPYVYSQNNPINLVDVSGGCTSRPPAPGGGGATPPPGLISPPGDPLICYIQWGGGKAFKWERIPDLNTTGGCVCWAKSPMGYGISEAEAYAQCILCNKARGYPMRDEF
jgi:RHS repeat-associated protein